MIASTPKPACAREMLLAALPGRVGQAENTP